MKNREEIKIWRANVAVDTSEIREGDIVISPVLGIGAVYETDRIIKAAFPKQKIFPNDDLLGEVPLEVDLGEEPLEDVCFMTPLTGTLFASDREYLHDYDRNYKKAVALLKTALCYCFLRVSLQRGHSESHARQVSPPGSA